MNNSENISVSKKLNSNWRLVKSNSANKIKPEQIDFFIKKKIFDDQNIKSQDYKIKNV